MYIMDTKHPPLTPLTHDRTVFQESTSQRHKLTIEHLPRTLYSGNKKVLPPIRSSQNLTWRINSTEINTEIQRISVKQYYFILCMI